MRTRGLRHPRPDGPDPEFGVYLQGRAPAVDWPSRFVRWPDFRLPTDRADALDALREALERSRHERVEVACTGGRGRTGTALAVMAALDGVPQAEAVAWVRAHLHPKAVETPWQARWVRTVELGAGRPPS